MGRSNNGNNRGVTGSQPWVAASMVATLMLPGRFGSVTTNLLYGRQKFLVELFRAHPFNLIHVAPLPKPVQPQFVKTVEGQKIRGCSRFTSPWRQVSGSLCSGWC